MECLADVSGGFFEGSDLSGASFYASRIQQASRMRRMPQRRQASFRGADLTSADFRGVLTGEYQFLAHGSGVLTLAVGGGVVVTGSHDGVVGIWSLATSKARCLVSCLCVVSTVFAHVRWSHGQCKGRGGIGRRRQDCVRQ